MHRPRPSACSSRIDEPIAFAVGAMRARPCRSTRIARSCRGYRSVRYILADAACCAASMRSTAGCCCCRRWRCSRCSPTGPRSRRSSTASGRPRGRAGRRSSSASTTTAHCWTTRCSGSRSSTICGSRSAPSRCRSRSRFSMALWVNDRIAGRALVRMAYFTPTVLPMIAVANIWLFFYTPQYGLLEQLLGALRSATAQLARHAADGACLRDRGGDLEGGGLLHDLLPRRAAADPRRPWRRRPRWKGASRLTFFRRVQFPLLMPTTLFVLVNAVINAFRIVDHIVVMTRGGPDNATALLLVLHLPGRLQLLGHQLRRGADDGAAGAARVASRSASIACSSGGSTTNEQRGHRTIPMPRLAPAGALETAAAWLLGILWLLPLSTRSGRPSIRPSFPPASHLWRR